MSVIESPAPPTTRPAVDPRVLRGAELLDRERPGWWREINLDALKIACPFNCVLGQLTGRWSDGLERLGLRMLDAHKYGFVSVESRAWADLIYARRKEDT